MRERDKAIVEDLQRFRCMTRDDIIFLYFNSLKNSVTCCNTVMKRLRRDNHVDVNTDVFPYVYFPKPSTVKKDSQKINHFLGILDVYKQMLPYDKPKLFHVEPKYGKEYMEPDAFVIWKGTPFFIEVQKSIYSVSMMQDKIKRYELYYHSGKWKDEDWQNSSKKAFPILLIITDRKYDVQSQNVRIYQAKSIHEFVDSVSRK